MGRRHIAGYAELRRLEHANIEVVGLCDLDENAAEELAEETRVLTGSRPRVFRSIATMAESIDGLVGIDITTDIKSHHRVAIECLDRGLYVQVEKPLAITMRAATLMARAARRNERALIVADNFRRDPMNRLARALIDDGAIGAPHMCIDISARGGDRVVGSAWRHDRLSGGVTLDLGIHAASILRYLLGDVESVVGITRLLRPVRRRPDDGRELGRRRARGQITATADDALWALLRFKSGAIGQWCLNAGAAGLPLRQRIIHGERGSLVVSADATGRAPRLDLLSGRSITDDALLEYAPSYRLDSVAARAFERDRSTSYSLSAVEVDRKLLALVLHEFGDVIAGNRLPEVGVDDGRRDVALVLAVSESAILSGYVSLDQVEDGSVDAHQRDHDADLGLIEVLSIE